MSTTTVGRPTKLTPTVHDEIIATIEAGNYAETAAQVAGVHPATFYRWMERGRTAIPPDDPDYDEARDAPDGPYREFRDAVERARARAEVRVVSYIDTAMRGGSVVARTVTGYDEAGRELYEERVAPPDGKLGLDYLSRVHKQRWARPSTQRVELTGAEGGPVEVESRQVSSLSASVQAAIERAAPRSIESPPPVDPRVIEGELARPVDDEEGEG